MAKPTEYEIKSKRARWLKELSHVASRAGERDEMRRLSVEEVQRLFVDNLPTQMILDNHVLAIRDLRNLREVHAAYNDVVNRAKQEGWTPGGYPE